MVPITVAFASAFAFAVRFVTSVSVLAVVLVGGLNTVTTEVGDDASSWGGFVVELFLLLLLLLLLFWLETTRDGVVNVIVVVSFVGVVVGLAAGLVAGTIFWWRPVVWNVPFLE